MLVKTYSAAVNGLDVTTVTLEVNLVPGIFYRLTGLGDAAVREGRDRIAAALQNNGFKFPHADITVNLAPADLRKEGSSFDLPLAIALLAADGAIACPQIDRYMMVGELSLDGTLQPVKGALPIAIRARAEHFKGLIVPEQNVREAENLAKLHHKNIVQVVDVFDENNTTYYVMKHIDGNTLDQYILSKGRLKEHEALTSISTVGEALAYMHSHNIIHLDLKPKNIMRDKAGNLLLIDFGLSKQYDEKGEPESSTSIGLGTPGYAPIEQANFKQDGTIPVTLDIYALGATLFKMLTGQTPPEASTILNDGFPTLLLQQAGVSAATIAVVEKAMSPMRKQRFQSMNEMLQAIAAINGSTASEGS